MRGHLLSLTLTVGLASATVNAQTAVNNPEGQTVPKAFLSLSEPGDRPDRLIEIRGRRSEALLAHYSTDGGQTWSAATVYLGTSTDDWCAQPGKTWNAVVRGGGIPPGMQACTWNLFFDLDLPCGDVFFRLAPEAGGGAGVPAAHRSCRTERHHGHRPAQRS